MEQLWSLINKYSSLVFITAVILAIIFPGTATLFHPYILYLLIALLFLGFVKTDLMVLKKEFRLWHYHIYLLVLTAVIIPIINYTITATIIHFTVLPAGFAIAALLIYSAPTAAATPTLCLLLKGRLERAMLNVVITSLLAPLTLPLIFYLLLGNAIEIPGIKLFSFVAMVLVLPFILALIIRTRTPKIAKKIVPAVQPLSILLLFFLMFGASSILRHIIANSTVLLFKGLLLAAILFMVTFALGWFLAFKKDPTEKITVAMVSSWTNLGLAIVIANQFFQAKHPEAMFLIIIATVIWNLAIALARPGQKLIARYIKPRR